MIILENDLASLVREIAGDTIESVKEIDSFKKKVVMLPLNVRIEQANVIV